MGKKSGSGKVLTRAEFAKLIGRSRARVTQLCRTMDGVRADGRIDVDKALQWIERYHSPHGGGWGTGLRKNDRPPIRVDRRATKPRALPEFDRGARYIAREICAIAREGIPALFAEIPFPSMPEDERVAARAALATVIIHLLERWVEDFVDPAELPPVNWEAFGEDAERLARETDEYRAQLREADADE